MEESEIVTITSRKLVPYILLFGLYLISYGHLSPGGGFQGGVVLGAGIILLWLSHSLSSAEERLSSEEANFVELAMILLFISLGLIGVLTGRRFLENFLPLGKVGEVPSAGFILLLNLIIGLEVGAGITLIFYGLAKYGERED